MLELAMHRKWHERLVTQIIHQSLVSLESDISNRLTVAQASSVAGHEYNYLAHEENYSGIKLLTSKFKFNASIFTGHDSRG